jgi:hypothetical protein
LKNDLDYRAMRELCVSSGIRHIPRTSP